MYCGFIILCGYDILIVFFFKQKTAYEMRISDWSSDVCSSDLRGQRLDEMEKLTRDAQHKIAELTRQKIELEAQVAKLEKMAAETEIGRASCRERVCQYV